ncbi:STAS domain-containing protein [Deltaproteobacteria bacterium TL4]
MLNEISCEIEREVCVFHLHDETVAVDTAVFISKLRELFDANPVRGYIFDFERVSFMPSMTIGFIFLLIREFGSPQTPFLMTGVSSMLSKVINMVGIGKLCENVPSMDQALDRLGVDEVDEELQPPVESSGVPDEVTREVPASTPPKSNAVRQNAHPHFVDDEAVTLASIEEELKKIFQSK